MTTAHGRVAPATIMITVTVDGFDFELEVEYEPPEHGNTIGPPESCSEPVPAHIEVREAYLTLQNGQRIDIFSLPEDLIRDEFVDKLATAALNKIERRAA